MKHLKIESLPREYAGLVRKVRMGDWVSPRSFSTRELQHVSLEFNGDATLDVLPTGTGRNINAAIGAAEALQLIGGCTWPELMVKIAPKFAEYANHDVEGQLYFHGAYGNRVGYQLPRIATLLDTQPDTRQAVLSLWDPLRDLLYEPPTPADLPCTVMLHFMVRDESLVLHAYMRSNDVWRGLPYDVFQFTQLQRTLASYLNLSPGAYVHHASSLHFYDSDGDAASIVTVPDGDRALVNVDGVLSPVQAISTFRDTMHRAEGLLRGTVDPTSAGEHWYDSVLSKYRRDGRLLA